MRSLTIFPGHIAQALKRTRHLVTAGALLAVAAQGASAACTYNIDNEWNTGFVASITIKNDTGAAINNWNINWSYSANRITNSWNANLSGSNPYTASNLGWNGNIAPGQSISFGFQGNKNNGAAAERPTINGAACNGGAVSSVRSSVAPSSVAPSSVAPSSVAPSSIAPSSSRSSVPSSVAPSSIAVTSSSRSSVAPAPRKFVGNITTSGAVRSDFINYWNQITPENEGKWGSVEATRDQYNWAPLDRIYAYARQHNIPVKAHTLVWGSQFPSWINNLSAAEQAAEIEEWIRDYCARYPDTAMIDVVNEATPGHAPAAFAQNAFGNNWIIKSFQLARQYCPNAILILNDYNVLSWNTAEFITMATPAINAGVVDALGMQAHGLADRPLSETTNKLNQIAALGLPIYISEYDIEKTNDQEQLQVMQQQFPLFYNHPSVKGITLWGYVVGKTWRDGTGLIQENGTPRPAMTWLMNYLATNATSSQSSVASSSRSSQSSAIISSSSSSVIVPATSSSSLSSTSSARSSSSSSIISTWPELVVAINAGGAQVNYNGVQYKADQYSTGGTVHSTTSSISNVAEGALFQSERYGTYGYEIPVTNSTYSIELHFAEIYQTTVGKRSFNVSVEGKQEMYQVDLYSLIGANAAYSYTVDNVQVTDGKLNIDLTTLVDNATLAGFAIYSSTGGKLVETTPPINPGTASKENEGADCVLGNPPAATSNAKLPDPFKKYNGARIASKADWRCQRQETLKQVEASIYGTKPGKPQTVTGTVSNSQITVNVQHQGKSASFSARVEMPSNTSGPVPAVVVLGGFGADTATIKAEGVAVIVYDPYVVGAESGSRSNKTGAFYSIYGNNSSTGLLAAWGWGVSRIIDVLEQSGTTVLKPDAIGVTGCSRFGKGAFAIGALDQRIALTMPFESGSGGVPIWRGIPGEGAQSPSSAYGETYWLGDTFGNYTADTKRLPVDTHQIIALVAPRGLFIMDNPHIANLGPKSAHAAALAGAEVYKALGATSSITYHSNVADGSHCSIRPEHKAPLQANIRRFLKKESATTGGINARSNATANINDWVDWTTPTLN
ncbi:glucuronyl esterase domain-containing protein [Cellvibrio sp. OA-2007]|uniref:glucuronyl esterase domain-containing protein n=1 Tax=Cellvibrio sp. OA-2007 TaxID=529823 RepID=UPI000B26F00D|nr:endo-1,4-beta-xylanase [Cellvibrio sp. OA-2007]